MVDADHLEQVQQSTELLQQVARAVADEHGVETRVVVADLTGDDLLARVRAGTDDLEVGLRLTCQRPGGFVIIMRPTLVRTG